MGVRAAIISLVFCCLIQHTTCICSLVCTTDYISSLNCSCLTQTSSFAYVVQAECWDEFDRVNASCEIKAPRHWCELQLDSEELTIGADTKCTVKGSSADGEWNVEPDNSINLTLYKDVKPQPPFNIQRNDSDSNCSISWEMVYTDDENHYLNKHLIYRVRIRAKDGSWKGKEQYTIHEDKRYLEVPYSNLQMGKEYVVDVQAKVSPNWSKTSHWSEWSPTTECTAKYEAVQQECWQCNMPQLLLCLFLPLFCLFLWLICAYGNPGIIRYLKKKVPACGHIPSPEDFFKPLYRKHGGDFTKWVGPTFVFSEFDFLESSMILPVVNGKHLKLLPGNASEDSRKGDGGLGSSFFLNLSTHSSSKQFLLGSCAGQDPKSSTGHISINTVTVTGEENTSSGGSWDPYSGIQGDCFPEFCDLMESPSSEGDEFLRAEPGRERAIPGGCMSGGALGTLSAPLGLYSLQWGQAPGENLLEQLSLDSFSSTERSDDGYPNVVLDLDTIDSGFLESDCSSPVHSDFDDKERVEAAVLGEAQHTHTNYVKQWVATTSAPTQQDDSTS